MNMENDKGQIMGIRRYLQFLDEDGWSELIDERWKVKDKFT